MDGAGGPVLRRPVRGAPWEAGFDAFAHAERRRLVAFAWVADR
jgi:hypothetical protein